MKLQLYKYTCHCGYIFKFPHLIGESSYGQFLVKSEIDELIYLCLIDCEEFQELSQKLEEHPKLKDRKDINQVDILQDLFSLVLDISPQKKIYQMNKQPNCPRCHLARMKSWIDVYPYEIVEMDIPVPTYHNWHQLSDKQKDIMIDKALIAAIQKSKAYNDYRATVSPWPTLSPQQRNETINKGEELNMKNHKILIDCIRSIKGL